MNYLKIYTKFFSISIAGLIMLGALITSNDAGLSVPDWPQSYGYNMFLFPYELWIGGIFYEHLHRLYASVVGVFTVILTAWLFFKAPSRGFRVAGFCALFVVCLQGLLGGLTVLYGLPDFVSVAHGVLAQTFFLLSIGIATFLHYKRSDKKISPKRNNVTTKYDVSTLRNCSSNQVKAVFGLGVITTIIVYLQLIIGAYMRHSQSGMAVPDFPTMGGSYALPLTTEALARVNAMRNEVGLSDASMTQVVVHLSHRFFAVCVVAMILAYVYSLKKTYSSFVHPYAKALKVSNRITFVLIFLQFSLGILTVLSGRAPWITSLHVVGGALLLGSVFFTVLCCYMNYKAIFIIDQFSSVMNESIASNDRAIAVDAAA